MGMVKVHPRACGGNRREWCRLSDSSGPSPRMRGKPNVVVSDTGLYRSIPAHAGETRTDKVGDCSSRVHPRACGGNIEVIHPPPSTDGPSPRMRGKRRPGIFARRVNRSIPAHAGETSGQKANLALCRVHPRACGGNFSYTRQLNDQYGPSPRMRGKPHQGKF